MIYITGDTHRGFCRIEDFCREKNTSREDVLIILGDAGINYFGDFTDDLLKYRLSLMPITLFCIYGNHEFRPSESIGYEVFQFHGGAAYVQKQYPNLVFARDGEVYDFAGNQCLVCGGAYSVDKFYRLANGLHWFAYEQPSPSIKRRVITKLAGLNYEVDIFLTHTCPFRYRPVEAFFPGIDESTIDTSTEQWFGELERYIRYKNWYCGHYHIEKTIDKIRFLYTDIVELPPKGSNEEISDNEVKSNA